MSTLWKRRVWALLKALLATAILLFVGRQFYRDLNRPEIERIQLRPAWLAVAAVVYVLGLGMSACFWYRLLWVLGQRPALYRALRACYISHLGKYVPGKAWALLMRGHLIRGPAVRMGVAIIGAFYEVLTTMASGALAAAVVFIFLPPEVPYLQWNPVLTGLLLLGLCGIPLLPGVFNAVVHRVTERFRPIDDPPLPPLGLRTLLGGLLLTGIGWSCLGLSTWALWQGVVPTPPPLDLEIWAKFSAAVGLAYVAGFLFLVAPGGVGVREYFLLHLLAFTADSTFVAAAVLLLRLTWTTAELVVAGLLVAIPGRRSLEVAAPETTAARHLL